MTDDNTVSHLLKLGEDKLAFPWTSPFLVGPINCLRGQMSVVTEKVKYSNKIDGSAIASPNILRFPRASVEPPRTTVLRGLADLLLPAGVSVYSRC
jgi:hypothetical protein